jgi:nitrogen fixation NifU-like protein
MSDKFERFVEKLQQKIIKKEIKDHNEKIVDLCYNPKNWGIPPQNEITIFEEMRGEPKNYLLGLYLKIKDGIILKANFITDGCGVMIATGSQTTILIEGKPIDYAENLTVEDIDKALMRLPLEERHCLDLAIKTLKSTIEKYKQLGAL